MTLAEPAPGDEPPAAPTGMALTPSSPHWVLPALSQDAGFGAVATRVLTPLGENVGLLQEEITMFCTTAPGIFLFWLKPACTRLIGSGE